MSPRVALLVLFLASACSPTTEWVPVRYSATTTGVYSIDAETNRCAHDCYDGSRDASGFYQCLALCPGVSADTAATCEDPTGTDTAFCYTHWVQREVEEPDDGGSDIAGDIIFGFFRILLEAAFAPSSNDGGHEEHHERRNVASRSSSSRSSSSSERSKPKQREYTPANPHRR